MNYRLLGKSGLRVSELCLGAMGFGPQWGYGMGDEESEKCLNAFLDAGGNFIDVADNYNSGHSEELLGKLVKGKRDRLVIATKCTLTDPTFSEFPGDPNGTGVNLKHLRSAVDASLKRLDTDYIDLLYVHVWDFLTPVEEVMQGLNDLVRSGKVNYIGVSNAPAFIVAEANTLAKQRGWAQFVVYEGQYNLFSRTIEREVLPMANHLDLAVTCWQPLAGAMLTADETEIRMRAEKGYPMPSDAQMAVIRLVGDIAKEVGASSPQVALNWLCQRPGVVIPIMGVREVEHVMDNVAATKWQLSAEQMKALTDATQIDLGYPSFELAFVLKDMVYNFMLGNIETRGRLPHYFS